MAKRQQKPEKRSVKGASERGSPTHSSSLTRRHLRIGWWSLLVFLSLGIVLEAMHGFKVQWYVGVDNSTRRLMWTLAHAHGVLVALVHLGYAGTIRWLGESFRRGRTLSSWSLQLAGILLPGGFFAGGLVVHGGDPGLGVLLVPIGGGLLFVSVILVAAAIEASPA